MKVRNNVLISHKAALLGGAMLVAMVPANSLLAAELLPVKAAPAEDLTGWYSNGTIEAGVNIFLQKPGNGFGRSPVEPFWLTPTTTDSNAKMDEYGKVPRGLFLKELGIQAGSKDGRYAVDVWADNVGMDNQRYYLGVYEPGRQYFNMGWDQTPHLLSSSAKSIFGGVGSTRLTVDPVSRAFLQSNLGFSGPSPNAQTQHQRNCIDDYINGRNAEPGCASPGAAPINNIELKTLREKFSVGYRNTMLDNWDFNLDYSTEHRTGTRPLGIGYGYARLFSGIAGTTSAPRPSAGSIEVPQPLDDRTQNANAAGEYVGVTPWGTRWSSQLNYSGSVFTNENKVLTVDNPFCITCVPFNGVPIPSGPASAQVGPNILQYGLYANNNAHGLTWNTAVDIPVFKSRYTSNAQYMMFRQNDPFINDATNGITTLAPYPAASLNGEVNAFLTNNVLYSHLTHDVSNTARVRYYDRKDNTPRLTFTNYVYGDGGVATTLPRTRDPHSYTRLNIEDDLKWQLNRTWTFGAGYFFERYTFTNGEVDATNESGVKAFVNATWRLATVRSSVQYAKRRYDNWLVNPADAAARAMRFFFVQNRDRTKANTVVELAAFKNITISPNGGVRWDEYPTDTVLNALAQSANSLGTQHDRSWNLGTDVGVRLAPDLRLNFGYNFEEHHLGMQSCCGGAAGGYTEANKWSSDITQRYNTFLAAAEWKAIPGKLDFKVDYVAAISNEANSTQGCTSNLNQCTGKNVATNPAVVWPDEHNMFQRFNAIAKYYVDPSYVRQMGFFGEIALKLRYTWERNRNSNWATDNFSPYSPSAADAGGLDITNGGKSLFLAYNNPNYTAQIIALSLAARW